MTSFRFSWVGSGTQEGKVHTQPTQMAMFVLHFKRDSPNASEIRFIFEDTSVDVKICKWTKLAESSDIRFRRNTVFCLGVL